MIECDAGLKPLVETFAAHVAATEAEIAKARRGRSIDYLAVERTISESTEGIERASHEAFLRSLVPTAERIAVDGKLYSRLAPTMGQYRTRAGEVAFERPLYREGGKRNGKTVDPVAVRVGAVGKGWLPGTARAMAFLLQLGTSRDAKEAARELGRLPYSRSSFERIPHLLGKLMVPHQAKIEELLIEEYQPPAEATGISVSMDRVSVPMEEARCRAPGRPRKNSPKRWIERNFRMAYCATATLHDKKGRSLYTIRYGRMPQGDSVGLAEALSSDVMAIIQKRPELDVTIVADGAPELWKLLEGQLCDGSLARRPHRLIDFWHLVEKLAAAAKVLYGAEADQLIRRWTRQLKRKPRGALSIVNELRDSGMQDVRVGDSFPVHDAITYIENNNSRMNYAKAITEGRPIGSGNIEATCKSLISVRMKRPGSRWKEGGGHRVIQLRAFALSDRWEPAMQKLFEYHRKPIRSAA